MPTGLVCVCVCCGLQGHSRSQLDWSGQRRQVNAVFVCAIAIWSSLLMQQAVSDFLSDLIRGIEYHGAQIQAGRLLAWGVPGAHASAVLFDRMGVR